jgi:tyrosinase
MAQKYVAERPVQLNEQLAKMEFKRADIRFHGVDHSGPTYEGRIFLNNPQADEHTPTTPDQGYAGSFYIFGHGGCFGDEGHCEVPAERRAFDYRPPHPLTPIDKVVTVTDALKRALRQGPNVHVTVVPVIMSTTEQCDDEHPLHFDNFEIVTYAS